MKKIWISSLTKDQAMLQQVLGLAKKYGLETNGHFWTDDVEKFAWLAALEELLKEKADVWIIVGPKEAWLKESIRFGLSLTTIGLQAQRGKGFPIIIINSGEELGDHDLPMLLKDAEILKLTNPSLGAKLVARANLPIPTITADYRLDIYAHERIGLWFEIGPNQQNWHGILFGVTNGEIDAHGVGPTGQLPQKTVLEYQMQGLKLSLGEKEYSAWAVKNTITPEDSYYVRVRQMAQSLIFGQYPAEDEELEVSKIELY